MLLSYIMTDKKYENIKKRYENEKALFLRFKFCRTVKWREIFVSRFGIKHIRIDSWVLVYFYLIISMLTGGTRYRSWFTTMLQTGRSLIRFPMRSLNFSIDLILPAALWLCSRLALLQKWVPGIFLEVNGGRQARKPNKLTGISEPIA
jgi:hypothetical protein